MNRLDFDNPMRRNVFDLPGLCRSQVTEIEKASRMVYRDEEVFGLRRIIITGCGDSLAAGMAGKYAFEYLAGIPVEVIHSLDLSRFLSSDLLNMQKSSTLVIAVSNSGGVSRVAEAVDRARRFGCLTLAITGNPESALALSAEKIVKLSIPPFESANGVRSYLVSILSLISVAIRFGEIKCRYPMTVAEGYRKSICRYADDIEAILETLDEKIFRIAETNTGRRMYDFVSSGPSYATAWFGHAKIIEATGDYASYSGVEDWFHLNCFLREIPEIFTMIITQQGGREKSRIQELLDAMHEMGRDIWIVTEEDGYAIPDGVEEIRLPASPEWWMSPLFNQIPASLLAGYMCELRHEAYGRGVKGPWAVCGTTYLLTKSVREFWD